jgi:hypothetical protein
MLAAGYLFTPGFVVDHFFTQAKSLPTIAVSLLSMFRLVTGLAGSVLFFASFFPTRWILRVPEWIRSTTQVWLIGNVAAIFAAIVASPASFASFRFAKGLGAVILNQRTLAAASNIDESLTPLAKAAQPTYSELFSILLSQINALTVCMALIGFITSIAALKAKKPTHITHLAVLSGITSLVFLFLFQNTNMPLPHYLIPPLPGLALLAGIGAYQLQTFWKNRFNKFGIAVPILLILLGVKPLFERAQLFAAEDRDIYRNQLTLVNLHDDLRHMVAPGQNLLTNDYARVVADLSSDNLSLLIRSGKKSVDLNEYDFLLFDWDERGLYVRGKDLATSLAEARQHPSFTIEWPLFSEYYNTYISLEPSASSFRCTKEYVLTRNGIPKVIKLFSRRPNP